MPVALFFPFVLVTDKLNHERFFLIPLEDLSCTTVFKKYFAFVCYTYKNSYSYTWECFRSKEIRGGGGGGTQTLEKLRPRKVNESQLKITALKRRLNNWPWTFNMCIKLQIVQVNNRQWWVRLFCSDRWFTWKWKKLLSVIKIWTSMRISR